MNISQPSDWYKVRREDVYNHGGQKLLQQYYDNSLSKVDSMLLTKHSQALSCWYPDTEVFPWIFHEKPPPGFWCHNKNQKNFFDFLMNLLGYECMDDWYQVTADTIHQYGGRGLLDHYSGSPSLALQSIYPEHMWELERFKGKPSQLWHKKNSQRRAFLISSTVDNVDCTPFSFWKRKENHRKFFDWLMVRLELKCMEDWYKVTSKDIYANGGGGLPNSYYSSSPSLALQSVYTNHNWNLERFMNKPSELWSKNSRVFLHNFAVNQPDRTPIQYWNSEENQRKFFDWIITQVDNTVSATVTNG
jgi:hypothetical protein